ncbi:Abscisic acid receptor pyl4 [Thalictrum thalictroides]|uniref:Abscisic acid receptor pyl4 n=1 Tax=Thalictrum thalictroides TaxID=46969 RepID=A0A7J6VJT2_THATH|nr:Abscisic acid receptor pyl4 [Thalictrum thalictroides]
MLSLIQNHNQCGSCVVQVIDAPLQLVWSIIKRFDKPQIYKKFIKNCTMLCGNGEIGSIREVQVVSGLPARVSIERLDQLDDETHTISFSMIGGDHALKNYHSTITLHESEDDGKTILVEAYVVDVLNGNTKEDTCLFVETIIKCNHKSLAWITEKSASSSSDDSFYGSC